MIDFRTVARERRWDPVTPLVLWPLYVLVCWLPVNLMAGEKPEAYGARGWPFVSLPVTIAVTALVLLFMWALVMRPGRWVLPWWACALGAVAAFGYGVWIYLLWVDHYAPVTDRATALQIGWDLLSSGTNPYRGETQLGNPIAPMLGGIVMAGGFIEAFGSLYWYGIFWLALVLVLVAWQFGVRSAFMMGALLVFTPAIRLELFSQSDSWINAAAICVFACACYLLAAQPVAGPGVKVLCVLAGVLFGLSLAYRYIYSPVALPLLVLMLRDFGWRRTAWCAVPAAVVSLVLALGPWLVAPEIYAPFIKADHADSDAVPYFSALLAVTMLLIYGVGAVLARNLSHVYATGAVAITAMILLLVWGKGGWDVYEAVAYDGAVLVFALFAAAVPRSHPGCAGVGTWALIEVTPAQPQPDYKTSDLHRQSPTHANRKRGHRSP